MKKRRWLYYLGCIAFPHIMLPVGIIFLTKAEEETKRFGRILVRLSLTIMVLGSIVYYVFFTPLFGLD